MKTPISLQNLRPVLCGLLLLVGTYATANAVLPAASEILRKSNDAIGGTEEILSKESYTIELSFDEGERTYRGFVWGRPPFDYRLEIHVEGWPGSVFTESSDGEKVWTLALTDNGPKFSEEPWSYSTAYDFYGPTLNPKEKGIEFNVEGRTEFNGTSAWELQATYPGGKQETMFIAAGSYLPLGFIRTQEVDGTEQTVRTVINEYEVIDDMFVSALMTDTIDGKVKRTVTLRSLMFDRKIPDSFFQPPADAEVWK